MGTITKEELIELHDRLMKVYRHEKATAIINPDLLGKIYVMIKQFQRLIKEYDGQA